MQPFPGGRNNFFFSMISTKFPIGCNKNIGGLQNSAEKLLGTFVRNGLYIYIERESKLLGAWCQF